MAEYTLVLSDAAVRDLEDIRDYIRRDDPEAASRFVDLIEERLTLLISWPQMGRVWADDTRYRVLVIEDYVVFYLVKLNTVHVRRIIHGARDLEQLLDT
ncbi:MAG: type II toxin-antitoxin system RelE/ParE family toxin [Bacillota bacterium]|nr:type II toxin-antitoxin system RelE/ParE family toxin [Bacillota bacterium]